MNHRSKTFSFYFFVHGQSLYGKERLDSALFPPKEAIEDWILKIQEEDTLKITRTSPSVVFLFVSSIFVVSFSKYMNILYFARVGLVVGRPLCYCLEIGNMWQLCKELNS